MRGLLRIRSTLAPFRRAGIAFSSTAEAVEVDVRTLDGERLLRLLREPALRIEIGQEDGSFRPAPSIAGAIPGETAQMMVDALTAELGPVGAGLPEDAPAPAGAIEDRDVLVERLQRQAVLVERLAGQADAIAEHLEHAGFDSIDALIAAHRRAIDALAPVQALADANGRKPEQTTADWVRALLDLVATSAIDAAPPAIDAGAEQATAEPAGAKPRGKAPKAA